jgi:hypothetical protein
MAAPVACKQRIAFCSSDRSAQVLFVLGLLRPERDDCRGESHLQVTVAQLRGFLDESISVCA